MLETWLNIGLACFCCNRMQKSLTFFCQAETEQFFLGLLRDVKDGIKLGFAQQFKELKIV